MLRCIKQKNAKIEKMHEENSKLKVENEELKVVNIIKSTLSADHRVLDGAVAAKLLKDFNDIIQNPFKIWLQSDDLEII